MGILFTKCKCDLYNIKKNERNYENSNLIFILQKNKLQSIFKKFLFIKNLK